MNVCTCTTEIRELERIIAHKRAAHQAARTIQQQIERTAADSSLRPRTRRRRLERLQHRFDAACRIFDEVEL